MNSASMSLPVRLHAVTIAVVSLLACGSSIFPSASAAASGDYRKEAGFGEATGDPVGGLAEGADGSLYGLSASTIYRYTVDGDITVVHTFPEGPTDGSFALGSLTPMPDGSLWGVTGAGGKYRRGTVFRFDPGSGVETTVHDFTTVDGVSAKPPLTLASDGFVYGVFYAGGPSKDGTIFRIDQSDGSFATVYAFDRSQVGRNPLTNLTEGRDGLLYGVISIPRHMFSFDPADGEVASVARIGPAAGNAYNLTAGPGNSLYGTTPFSDDALACGTVYSVVPQENRFNVLHNFDCISESTPAGPLLLASDGFLYGVTIANGPVYRLRPSGRGFDVIDGAPHAPDSVPVGGLLEEAGVLYGVAVDGGGGPPRPRKDHGTLESLATRGDR